MATKWNNATDLERKQMLRNIGIGGLGWLTFRYKHWRDLPKNVRVLLEAEEKS